MLFNTLREAYRSWFPSPPSWAWRYRIETDEHGEFHAGLIEVEQTIQQIITEAGAGSYILTIEMKKLPEEQEEPRQL